VPIDSAGPGVGRRCACHCFATAPVLRGGGAAGAFAVVAAPPSGETAVVPASVASKTSHSAAAFTPAAYRSGEAADQFGAVAAVSASTVSITPRSTGLTRCTSKPASCARTLSLCWP